MNVNKVSAKLKNSSRAIEGAGVGFEFTFGRKSRQCHGFGVCELTAFWIDIWKNGSKEDNESKNVFSGVIFKNDKKVNDVRGQRVPEEDAPDYLGYVLWDVPVQEEVYDTTFYVDEDIVLGEYVLKAGEYPLTGSLGDYGGYELSFEKL